MKSQNSFRLATPSYFLVGVKITNRIFTFVELSQALGSKKWAQEKYVQLI